MEASSSTPYKKLAKIGQGSYGSVYKAVVLETGQIVAIKRVTYKDAMAGVPVETLREIALLRKLSHENIIELLHLHRDMNSIELVLSWADQNLREVMHEHYRHGRKLPRCLVKNIAFQLFKALAYLHGNSVVHRDIKPENIMITKDYEVKVADFGISRTMTLRGRPMTPNLQTLYYRAPEMALGDSNYSSAVDMWSVGSLLFELMTGRPLFSVDSNMDLVIQIMRIFGTPDPASWPNLEELPFFRTISFDKFASFRPIPFEELMPEIAKEDPNALELLKGLLQVNPRMRISAKEALNSSVLFSF